ncbi:MAG: hypothetical protein ABI723_22085 [Bacteroidia bacterium]
MEENKSNNKDACKEVNEPQQSYGMGADEKDIHFFSSFEEMEEDNYKWLASLTPEQHLANATAFIKRIFAEELKKNPNLGNTLTID